MSADKSSAPAESPSPTEEGAAPAPAPETDKPARTRKPKARTETYLATRPDGVVLKVVRNIDTGEATYTEA